MKLFLASSLDETMSIVAPQLPKNGKVLFIANAGDHYTDTWWIENDRKAFRENGFVLNECDVRALSEKEFAEKLAEHDIVHVAGGSVFYLIMLLRKQKLGVLLAEAVRSGKVIYTGTSAGSMIVAPSVWPCKFDEEDEKFIPEMAEDFSGLNIVPFLILPHCDSQSFSESNAAAVGVMEKYSTPFIMLYDNQVVMVEDAKYQIIFA